ncbi:MAG: SLOG family protein [Rikenellaceae bacterium]
MNISFTGHRDYNYKEHEQRLNTLLVELVESAKCEVVNFYSGMAKGFDIEAAMSVLLLREEYPNVRLHAVIPYTGQANGFDEVERAKYEVIKETADSCVVLSKEYHTGTFHQRNDYLVDKSEIVVAYYNGEPKGGTHYTVRRARKRGRKLYNLCPPTSIPFFGVQME